MSVPSPWLCRCGGPDDPAVRVVCLPWAGGAASAFRPWRLPPELGAEVWAVQWPGRETRWREPLARHLDDLVGPLRGALAPLRDRPLVLFGHSMGALVAYEVARLLERDGVPPALLVASAHRAPHTPAWRPAASTLPTPHLLARLDELGHRSRRVPRNRALLTVLEPVLRADFALCERYVHRAGPPLSVPVLALGAVDDPEVRVEEVLAWSERTVAGCSVRWFDGGHLFVLERAPTVLEAVAAAVAGLPAAARRELHHG